MAEKSEKSYKLTPTQAAEVESALADSQQKYAPIAHLILESAFDAGPFFEHEKEPSNHLPDREDFMTDREDFNLGRYKEKEKKPKQPTVRYCSTRDKFPTEKHWGIWIFKQVRVPDLYSRDREALMDDYQVEYRAYLDVEEWRGAIRELELRKESYTASHVNPAQVSVDVQVNVDCGAV